MGMFASAVLRSKTGEARMEDCGYEKIYFAQDKVGMPIYPANLIKIYGEEPKDPLTDYGYNIFTSAGHYPVLSIVSPYKTRSRFGVDHLDMTLQDGTVLLLEKLAPGLYGKYFNKDTDYYSPGGDGRKYSIPELKRIAQKFIKMLKVKEPEWFKPMDYQDMDEYEMF